VQAGLVLVLAFIVWLVSLAPETALLVLGPEYAGLTHEVVLVTVSGALSVLAGSAYTMSAARGIVVAPLTMVGSSLAVQILLIVNLPIDTAAGVLWLGAFANAFSWLLYAGYFSISCPRGR
jgi:hypothetical protein